MQTTLETLGALERRLNVAVPIAEIEGEVKKRLWRLARTAKVAGFRPGKVPMRMLDQQYGPQLRSDVITERVQSTFNEAVRAQNLRVAGVPRIEPARGETPAPDALEFSAVFEVYPDVKVGDVASIEIARPQAEVTPADVDRTLDVLRKQRTTYSPVDRAAQAGDRVTVDFTGTIDGVEFPGGQAKNFPIILGEGGMLPEFEAALTGIKAGDARQFGLTFPADYHGREVAGKTAQFSLTALGVEEPHVPALDAEFVHAFGIASGNVDDLRREVEANLKLELKRKIEATVKAQALQGLRKQASFAIPKSLIEGEAQLLRQRAIANLREQRNVKPEDLEVSVDLFRPQAEERVALGLIIGELVRNENLQAKPEQVRALVTETAQTYEQPEAVVRWHYENPERLRDFEAVVLEQNVVDWVLARAKVTDEPTTFEQVMGPRTGG
ncbi:MAG TPA: trigger factor [Casimicrobiaceae bacterium]|nr:trigger factor [Casimicrobiaceae bacterium]